MKRLLLVASVVVLTTACASSAATTPDAAINGRVLSAPSCPVEQAGVPCPPRPVAGASVEVFQGGREIASTQTGKRGGFHLTVPPGRYRVLATNVGGYASTAAKFVTVSSDDAVFVRLVVDSGIR
jgi:hypothetical protein